MSLTLIVKTIWLADDDPDDLHLFQDALDEVCPSAHLTTFSNGEKLLQGFFTLPAPDLLFLDINMPCDGYDCLKAIRDEGRFNSLPVIIYSGSFRESDITDSYQLGANLYIRKPLKYRELLQTLKSVLLLDWRKAEEITSRQYVGNMYVPFTAQSRE